MQGIEILSEAFSKYYLFPSSCYIGGRPLRVFQELYPQNYYLVQVDQFLFNHQYPPKQRGSDMPWWGSKYFSDEKGYRVFIISQDSLASDAGSIVFWANLFNNVKSKTEYERYTSKLNIKNLFRYSRWIKVYDQLLEWGIPLDFCYITDAAKVYKLGSWKDRDFDKVKSRELVLEEIRICKPDLVITLGSSPITLLNKKWNYGELVEEGKTILLNGSECCIAPFFIGNGPTQQNFKKRFEIASQLIKSKVNLES